MVYSTLCEYEGAEGNYLITCLCFIGHYSRYCALTRSVAPTPVLGVPTGRDNPHSCRRNNCGMSGLGDRQSQAWRKKTGGATSGAQGLTSR